MDPETEAYIEEAKREREEKSTRRFNSSLLADADLPGDILDPSVRLHEMRERRTKERLREKLDRVMPVAVVEVEDAKVWVAPEQGDGAELLEGFTGRVYEVRTRCTLCRAEIVLRSIEPPNAMSRSFVFGAFRRALGVFACDECVDKAQAATERAETAQAIRKRREDSRMPAYMQGLTFEEMIPGGGRREIVNELREWAAADHPGQIYLHGDKGAGKTRLAATAAWARLNRFPLRYASLPALIAELGQAFSDEGRRQAIQVLVGQGPLVLDDIARDDIKVSDWAKTQVFTAIDKRIQAGAPLLLTSNMAPDRLGPVLGGSTMSRCSGMRTLRLPGRDMRLQLDGVKETQAAEERAARDALPEPEES